MFLLLPSLWLGCTDNTVKTANSAPEIIISSHSDNLIFVDGEQVVFTAMVSDENESSDNLRTSWYLNNTTICDWTNANEDGTSVCTIPMVMGATQVSVSVKDSSDLAQFAALNLQVLEAGTDTSVDTGEEEPSDPDNLAPVVFMVTPETGDIFMENEPIDFRGLVHDYEDPAETLSIEWSSDQTGVIDISNADEDGNTNTQATLPSGTHEISLSVTDSEGLSTTKTNTIEVQTLSLPTVQCQILDPNDGDTIVIGNSGNLMHMDAFVGSSGSITDLSYNFSSDLNGWLGSGSVSTDGSVAWSGGTTLNEATHTFSLDITYMGQSVCTDSIQVTIEQPVLTITHKKVFVSSQGHNGDFGGLAGADDFCQNLAMTAGLSGTYKAWLSDSTGSPATRFTPSSVPYRLVDGTDVASDWNDLTDGTIMQGIDLDEYGNQTSSSFVFSYTLENGTAGSPFGTTFPNCQADDCHCNNWTDSDPQSSSNSAVGQPSETDDDWTEYSSFGGCDSTIVSVYCFEQ